MWKKPRVGVALGGGGARGIAHVGVLKVFESRSVPIHLIAGTSIGALVGGAYAAGFSAKQLEDRTMEFLASPLFRDSALSAIERENIEQEKALTRKIHGYVRSRLCEVHALFRPGVLSQEEFRPVIEFFIPDIGFEDTRIPFRAIATDLISGEQVVFDNGSLRQAIVASCAVPGAVEPLKEGGRLLSDGGIICLVPASVARENGADLVIAVEVGQDIFLGKELRSALSVYYRASDIMAHRLTEYELRDADIVIRPGVGTLGWADFSKAEEVITAGEEAAAEQIQDVCSAASGRRRWTHFIDLLRGRRRDGRERRIAG
ncbi:MAG TPA: patatin [Desulfobacteraceae bacterium]|nr:patatin [Desulfobacteraceae bacterium]